MVTILFKVNYRKYLTVRQLIVLVGTQFLMALLSFFASLSVALCILLNLTVPFLLVFLQTSQFNPLGYFANAMCFVFLQLRPVGWDGLAMQMGALAYGLAVLTIILFLCSLQNRKNDHFAAAKKGLLLLAAALRAQIEQMSPTAEQTDPSGSLASGQMDTIFRRSLQKQGPHLCGKPPGENSVYVCAAVSACRVFSDKSVPGSYAL